MIKTYEGLGVSSPQFWFAYFKLMLVFNLSYRKDYMFYKDIMFVGVQCQWCAKTLVKKD